jgi:alanine racemase
VSEGTDERLRRLRPARARIDLDRLAGNYRAVASAVDAPLMPVVKADAYGHGAVRVAAALESLGAAMLAVAYVEEGVALREAGLGVPIVVLAGFGAAQVSQLADHSLTPVLASPGSVESLLAADRRPPAAHVKVDTGMGRLGFAPAALVEAALRAVDGGTAIEGVMTQLACADEDAEATARQLDRFDEAVAALGARGVRPRWIHACNSAGLAFLRPSHTLARPGLLLYGLRPRPLSPDVAVRPVMQVSADVALVKDVAAGAAVSYGARWVARRPSRIATLPVGYADGVPRTDGMRDSGRFVIAGRSAPVTGTVCMDLTMADVTDLADVRAGEEAVLFGDEPSAWEVAERAGTNAWQVLTAIGARVPRVYVQGGRTVAVHAPGS